MNSILKEIIENKKNEVRRAKNEVPLTDLLGVVRELPAPLGFGRSLRVASQVAVIAEIKKASPSAGVLRANFEPAAISKCLLENGASAISVLTDLRYFGGQLDDLKQVRGSVTLPLLRKDFILEPYQVAQARAHGADAILLIVHILAESQCVELAAAAREYGLDVLTEVHTRAELECALNLGAEIVGINNRNLDTFEVDLATTHELISSLPSDVIAVAESGIRSRTDIEQLGAKGVDAVLIGESLMRRKDLAEGLNEFVGVRKWSR